MATFEYEAIDSKGAVKSGVIAAETARLARRELRAARLVPVRVVPSRRTAAGAGALATWWRAPRVGSATMMLMTRQLATMIGAASPIEEALHTIAAQSENTVLRGALLSVRTSVMEGFRFSDALAQYPRLFSPLYRSLVAAGEMSGKLGIVLERLADHLEKSEKMRAKVLAALLYPLVLTVVAILVVGILMTFVVPKVIEQFDTLGQQLPLLTRLLIGVSEGIAAYGLAGLVLLIVGIAGAVMALRRPPVRRRVDQALLRLPFIGKLLRGLYTARLARTLHTLLAGGSPITEALVAAQPTVRNRVFQDAVARVGVAIREGSSLSAALRRAELFPPMVIYMASAGENTGRLAETLGKAAEHLESEFETVTAAAIGLVEPLIILLMGGAVALIVLAIMMPMLQLNSLATL